VPEPSVAPILVGHENNNMVRKGGTGPGRQFTWQSFSQRVEKVKVNGPWKRKFEDDESSTELAKYSSFRSSLARWSDTNLCITFSDFARDVKAYCDSLPLVILHKDVIFSLLRKYMAIQDPLAMEALLDLLAQLVNDLNVEFLPLYENALTELRTCFSQENLDVVEQAFTALVAIFKYMSRIITSDPLPTFHYLCPLLGKSKEKSHVTRFTAEALSFLFKRCPPDSLDRIAQAMLAELESPGQPQYVHGMSLTILEVMKNVDHHLHSRATRFYEALLNNTLQSAANDVHFKMLGEVLTGVIHFSTAETFEPFLTFLLKYTMDTKAPPPGGPTLLNENRLQLMLKLLGIIASVRKGSRISNQEDFVRPILTLLENSSPISSCQSACTYLVAVIFKNFELPTLIPTHQPLIRVIETMADGEYFLSFCNIVSQFSVDCFKEFLELNLHKFLFTRKKWSEKEGLFLFAHFSKSKIIQKTPWFCQLPDRSSYDRTAAARIMAWLGDRKHLPIDDLQSVWCYTTIYASFATNSHKLAETFVALLRFSIDQLGHGYAASIIPPAIQAVILHDDLTLKNECFRLLTSAFSAIQEYEDILSQYSFLCGQLLSIHARDPNFGLEELISGCIDLLRAPSSQARLASLNILQLIYESKHGCRSEHLRLCETIEQMPLSVSSHRDGASTLRNLGAQFLTAAKDEILAPAIVSFLFGIQDVKLAIIGEGAREALQHICAIREDLVWDICETILLLEATPSTDLAVKSSNSTPSEVSFPPFTCHERDRVETLFHDVISQHRNLAKTLENQMQSESKKTVESQKSKLLILKVLLCVPSTAEKHSRHLVPFILENDNAISSKDWPVWLALFSLFHNPKVLYRSDEVYRKMLLLLSNGDVSLQRYALKCVLSYREPGVTTYADHLESLLDDNRFREVLALFLHVESSDLIIQDGHRPQLMPVLVALLYGRCIGRKGGPGNAMHYVKRRSAVLRALAVLESSDVELFVDAVLQPFGTKKLLLRNETYVMVEEGHEITISQRQGFLTMFADLLCEVAGKLASSMSRLMDGLFSCITMSLIKEEDEPYQRQQKRDIRNHALRCLTNAFEYATDFDFDPYMDLIMTFFVSPCLSRLPEETSQGVSAMLALIGQWSKSPRYMKYFDVNKSDLLIRLEDCLIATAVKPTTLCFILEILSNLLQSEDAAQLFTPAILNALLNKITSIISVPAPVADVLTACMSLLNVAKEISNSGDFQVESFIKPFMALLDLPNSKLRQKTKSEIIIVISGYLAKCNSFSINLDSNKDTFTQLISFFAHIRDRPTRDALVHIVEVSAEKVDELKPITQLVRRLNSFSARRLDTPDFNERLAAFTEINESRYEEFSPIQWLPLIENFIFYIQDLDELSFRASAAFGLRRFLERALQYNAHDDFGIILKRCLFPAMIASARNKAEAIRREFLSLISHALKQPQSWYEIKDMQVLRFGDNDDEASFFENITHIQQHRRLRALRRLSDDNTLVQLSSANVAHYLLPLVEHFVFELAGNAHNLSAESIGVISKLACQLTWVQYKAVSLRYLKWLRGETHDSTIVFRLIAAFVEAMSYTTSEATESKGFSLRGSIPSHEVWRTFMMRNTCEPLLAYVHQRDGLVSSRIPVATTIVKVLKLLSEEEIKTRLPGLLTDICHILRSRAQESRDLTRACLCDIIVLLGAQYLPFLLKELRGALLRGYQLHVLGYTVHSILVKLQYLVALGDLTTSAPLLIDIIIDDIFGTTGQEKDAEGYVSSMREVKGNKSYDSMEILTCWTDLSEMYLLIQPIQQLLQQPMTMKLSNKLDELLRRLQLGIVRNPAANKQEILVFGYQLFKHSMALQDAQEEVVREQRDESHFLVKSRKRNSSKSTSRQNYKLARFAIDVLRSSGHKYPALATPANLGPLIEVAGDAVLAPQETLQIAGFRFLSMAVRIPTTTFEESGQVFAKQVIELISQSPSTNTELCQACLKFVAAALRHSAVFSIADASLAYVLQRISSDLEEPDRQGVIFALLRSLLDKRVMIPEMYDTMDLMGKIMITNQTTGTRDAARSLYLQFLLEYPQGRGRLQKQLQQITKNLEYAHASGRQSTLEALNTLLVKLLGEMAQETIAGMFVPLVMVLLNDESVDCREMAASLLRKACERASQSTMQPILGMLREWIHPSSNGPLIRAGMAVFVILTHTKGIEGGDLSILVQAVQRILQEAGEWEIVYSALQTWLELVTKDAQFIGSQYGDMWSQIYECLAYRHFWVRGSAAKAVSILLGSFGKYEEGWRNEGGLAMDMSDAMVIMHKSMGHLRLSDVPEDLAMQSTKNLVFFARSLYEAHGLGSQEGEEEEHTGVGEEESDDEDGVRPMDDYLPWLLSHMASIIRANKTGKESKLGKRCALHWIGAVMHFLQPQHRDALAETLVATLVGHESDEAAETAEELLATLHRQLGTTRYAQARHGVHQRITDRREERRTKRAVEVITHPQRAAQSKRRKHEKKGSRRRLRHGVSQMKQV